jgi:hypothetical protein
MPSPKSNESIQQIVDFIGMEALSLEFEKDAVVAETIYHLIRFMDTSIDSSDAGVVELLKSSSGRFTKKVLPLISGSHKLGSVLASLQGNHLPFLSSLGMKKFFQALSSNEELFSPKILLRLLMMFRDDLVSKSAFYSDRSRLFCSLKLCLLLNPNGFLEPILFQWTIAFLIDLLDDVEMISDCVNTIASLCGRMAASHPAAYHRSIISITANLVQVLERHEKNKAAQTRIAKAVVALLTSGDERVVRLAVVQMDRGNPALGKVFEAFKGLERLGDDGQLLDLFGGGMNRSSLITGLVYLRSRLGEDDNLFKDGDLCSSLAGKLIGLLQVYSSDLEIGKRGLFNG